jgi:membrane-bound metal-dependent hydrolase YbcI (DUF457 family)
MCMGKTHARQGVFAGVVMTAVGPPLTLYGPPPITLALAVAMLVVGASVFPDIDHPEATVAHTFGPVSHTVSKAVHATSSAVYGITRSRRDQDRDGGHRGLTHTALFAAGCGVGAYFLITAFGLWAAAGILFVFTSYGLRGLAGKWAHRHGWLFVTSVAAAFTGASVFLAWSQPAQTVAWWFAIAIGVGCLVHLFGDCVTTQGGPVFWPIPLRGQRWRMVGTPKFMRFDTDKDSRVELWLGRLALILAGFWLSAFTIHSLTMA